MIPHNDRPNQTLTACAPDMCTHTCVFVSRRLLYSSFDTRRRPAIMPMVRTSTAQFGPNSGHPLPIERQPTIEYP